MQDSCGIWKEILLLQTVHLASVNINDDIVYQFSYGDIKKFKNGEEAMSANGYTYKEFIEMIQINHPIYEQHKILIMTK
jgi:hypothetical protein